MKLENVLPVLMRRRGFQYPMELVAKGDGWSLTGLAYKDQTVRFLEEGKMPTSVPNFAVEITDANENVARMTMTPSGEIS
jgi:hypothetical protein